MRKAILLVVLAVACASSPKRPANVAQPEILLESVSPIFFGSGTTSAASLNLIVTNTSTVPLTLARVRIETSGPASYALRTFERNYRETLAPGESKVFPIVTQAYAATAGLQTAEPLNLRVFADFEAGDAHFREVSLQQINAM